MVADRSDHMSQVPIRSIWVFQAAARAGSISRAAEELNVTPSAVTQQVQALETQLGVALLTKVGRGILLTEAGARFFASINDGAEQIAEATNVIRGYRSITALTVRATPTLSNKWLLPRLDAFLAANPDLEVRLDGTNEPTDFNREAVDLEIRCLANLLFDDVIAKLGDKVAKRIGAMRLLQDRFDAFQD